MDSVQRSFLTADLWEEWRKTESDQKKGIAIPVPEKPHAADAVLVDLVAPDELTVGQAPLLDVIRRRRSQRHFTSAPLTLEELSFLLWATQGVSKVVKDDKERVLRTFRTVPSGGARHPFETYLLVNRVAGVEPGLYRYLPLEHKLCLLRTGPDLVAQVHDASNGQYILECAVVFMWTAIPYRTEWRYGIVSAKIIAQDSGHMCQNLYLASTAIGCGTCGLGAYNQAKMDRVLDVDAQHEFTIYMAPVGKIE
jgi:SagB-type dehydrogenase family enzyme